MFDLACCRDTGRQYIALNKPMLILILLLLTPLRLSYLLVSPAPRTKAVSASIAFVVGFVLLILAGTLPTFINKKLEKGVLEATILTQKTKDNNDAIYRTFVDPEDKDSTPVYTYFYTLTCTNTEDVVTNGAAPAFQEKGPYVYRKLTRRENVAFLDNGGYRYVRFVPQTSYRFDADQTPKDLDPLHDEITVPNIDFFTDYILKNSGLMPAEQFFAKWGNKTDEERLFVVDTVHDYLSKLHLLDSDTPNTKYDEWYTGEGNPGMTGILKTWKEQGISTNMLGLQTWQNSQANILTGTDGTRFNQFQPECSKARVTAFVTEAGRTVSLSCEREYTVNGITLYQFGISPEAMLPADKNPENAKYNMKYQGVFDVSSLNLISVALTKPHFLDAPDLLARTQGLTPDRALHDIVIGVEPISGVVMDARKSLQVNFMTMGPFKVDGHDDVEFLAKVPADTPLPPVWVSERGRIGSSSAKKFRGSVYAAQSASKYIISVGCSIGSILVFFSFAWFVYDRNKLLNSVTSFPDYPVAQPADRDQHLEINYHRI